MEGTGKEGKVEEDENGWGSCAHSFSTSWIYTCLNVPLNGPFMHGGLSARPTETLLIYRRVNSGKFCTFVTLLSHLLSIKWRKYEYNKLINESLAGFLLYLPC